MVIKKLNIAVFNILASPADLSDLFLYYFIIVAWVLLLKQTMCSRKIIGNEVRDNEGNGTLTVRPSEHPPDWLPSMLL